ncbi:hypothetical protein RND71_037267 [Anisodus tanguticus]|uniref:Calponin-homology (CH) domain-containing protein n=1 Tax=Anisodus tanguticus TaxID=243964 RepID=A0AAE1R313_9SOLA|nr:hypothetical protein RND71_037267 [Anisodus tanguticus]
MSSFVGVIVSDQWLQSRFTQVKLRGLNSNDLGRAEHFPSARDQSGKVTLGDLPPVMCKLKAFQDVLSEDDIQEILSESSSNMSEEIDFESFLRAYLNLQARATAKKGDSKTSSSFLKATTTTLRHTISESERASYVAHINSFLRDDPFLKDFLPIDPSSNQLKLINLAVPGTIDERAINTKKVLNPWERNENHTLCLNSAKAIGCTVVNIGTQDLIEERLDLNLRKTPQLAELVEDSKEVEELMSLSPEKVLLKWMNFHLKKAGYKKEVTNFSSDLKDGEAYAHLLNTLAPEHGTTSTLDTEDPTERANLILEQAEKLDCKRYVTPKNIVEGSANLNLAFVVQIFQHRNRLTVDTKKLSFAVMMEDGAQTSLEERCFRWVHLVVLDKISQGLVNWKHATKPPIKMPFRKVENCNQVISIGKELNFSLVNVAGNDIVQGNKKLILVNEVFNAPTVEKLEDKSISSGKFFLELLSAVEPRVVNWSLVTTGKTDEDKKLNATYIISVARKLGCSIFLLPEDIIEISVPLKMRSDAGAELELRLRVDRIQSGVRAVESIIDTCIRVNQKMMLTLTVSIMPWSLQKKTENSESNPAENGGSDVSPAATPDCDIASTTSEVEKEVEEER